MPGSAPRSTRHFLGLDGLRGVAALFVVLLHATAPFGLNGAIPHAELAVDFFFLLSGFVITHAYEKRLLSALSLGGFLRIRLTRLYPLYLLGLVIGVAVYAGRTALIGHTAAGPDVAIAIASNLLMLPTVAIRRRGWADIMPFDIPAWSLFFEMLVNLAYVAALPLLSGRVLRATVVAGALLVFLQAYHLGAVTGGGTPGQLVFGLGRVIYPFFLGVLLYRMRAFEPDRAPPFLVVVALLALSFLWRPPVPTWLFESLVVVGLYPLLVMWGSRCRLPAAMAAACRFAGDLSYPLYILHYPFVHLFSHLARQFARTTAQVVAVIAVEILFQLLLAYAAARLFDEPVRAWLSGRLRAVRA
ncbi:MAG: acyltransferase [Rhodospirillales bacterium]|nr:acyltransferase [Rhodospirillales bacterium]